jgi:hypothetical protein
MNAVLTTGLHAHSDCLAFNAAPILIEPPTHAR